MGKWRYKGWSISNEKIRDANDYGQIHFTVFQYNPHQAQVLASLHRPRRTVCLAVRTSHLSCGWPLHHSQSSAKRIFQRSEHVVVRRSQVWWIRQLTEQFEAAFSNCSHCHGRGVGRCIVLMRQHTVTQLSASFLLDSRSKFPDQFSVVNTSNILPSLQVVNHQHTITIPAYRCHDFASRGNLAKLYWRRRSDMLPLIALLLGHGIEVVSPSLVHGDISAEKLRWICVVQTEIVKWSEQTITNALPINQKRINVYPECGAIPLGLSR